MHGQLSFKSDQDSVIPLGEPDPRLLPPRPPYKIPMLRPRHRPLRPRINHRDPRSQKHLLLHPKLRQMIIRPTNLLTQRRRPNHLGHVPVVLVAGGARENFGPALVG